MRCLSEGQVSEYVFETLDISEMNKVKKHIKSCDVCKKAVMRGLESLNKFQNDILQIRKQRCPSSEDLFNYNIGTLDVEKKSLLEVHINNCFMCKADLRTYDIMSDVHARTGGRNEKYTAGAYLKQVAYQISKDVIAKVHPKEEKYFDIIWNGVSRFADSIQKKDPASWQSLLSKGVTPAYGLAFSESLPDTDVKTPNIQLCVIALTKHLMDLPKLPAYDEIWTIIQAFCNSYKLTDEISQMIFEHFKTILK